MDSELQQALNILIDRRLASLSATPVQLAKVLSVDKDKCTCKVELLSGIELFEVKLRSVADDDKTGFVVFPKVDSMVLVCTINNSENNAYLLAFSTITDITIDADILINGGENKGLVKLPELVQKLNNIEIKVNDVIAWSQTHTHAGVIAGGGTSGVAVGVTGSLETTTENDLENKKVKH